MITSIKRLILSLLQERGYVLLKLPEYVDLTMRAESPKAVVETARSPLVQQISHPTGPAPADFGDLLDPVLGAEVQAFAQRARAIVGQEPAHAPAIYMALRYLTKVGVKGDIVDCGEGAPTMLVLAALALNMLGARERRLVLFDVTADPSHFPELEMTMWGSDSSDYLDGLRSGHKTAVPHGRPVPAPLAATGYPPSDIVVARYPADTIDLSRPIAFLSLTSETYEANQAAIRALIPRLSRGGVLLVEGATGPRPSQLGCVQHGSDAVKDYLGDHKMEFWQATEVYRLAVWP